MKKRPRGRRSTAGRARARSGSSDEGGRQLQYKVVELSTVDEAALERTLNEWVPQGWRLENVQFAMRESSKRPAMAFVFFTREAPGRSSEVAHRHVSSARERLRRLAEEEAVDVAGAVAPVRAVDPRQRLMQLAGMDELEPEE